MKNMLVGIVLVSLVGCGVEKMQVEAWREVSPPVNAQLAIDTVVSVMGIQPPYEVHWYGNLDADCNDSTGWHPLDDLDICIGGEERGGIIEVAYVEGRMYREIPHEFGHLLSEQRYGDTGDPDHVRADIWDAGGAVEKASEALGALGALGLW